jgi:hypothetical protein
MLAWNRIVTWCLQGEIAEPEDMSIAIQWQSKHIPVPTDMHATTEELLECRSSCTTPNHGREKLGHGSCRTSKLQTRPHQNCSLQLMLAICSTSPTSNDKTCWAWEQWKGLHCWAPICEYIAEWEDLKHALVMCSVHRTKEFCTYL